MKKCLSILICLVLSLGATGTLAEDDSVFQSNNVSQDGIFYFFARDEYTASSSKPGLSGEIVIPEEINGYPVTGLAWSLFSEQTNITSVILPETITKLPPMVFAGCKNLEQVKFSDKLTEIGYSAFGGTALTEINIPDSVKSIDENALPVGITQLKLPKSLEWIAPNAAAYCNLKDISIDENNPYFTVKDNVLYNKDMTEIKLFPSGFDGEYVLPETITTIPDNLFSGANVKNIVLHDKVTAIGEIYGCPNLTSLTIPNSVTSVGKISYCRNLEGLVLHDNVTYFGGLVGSSLENITIPESVTKLGSMEVCTNLKQIIIPDSVVDCKHIAYNCKNLDLVVVGKGVRALEHSAISGCKIDKLVVKSDVNLLKETVYPHRWSDDVVCYVIEKSEIETIYAYRGTSAEEYAKLKNIPFVALDDNEDIYLKDNLTVKLNGGKIKTDSIPYIKNDRTMVPMRAIFEALGATVTWVDETKTAIGVKGDAEVKITIGENVLYKNGKAVELDCAAEITNDRTMVPVRAISEAFGCTVNWNDETKTVEITN